MRLPVYGLKLSYIRYSLKYFYEIHNYLLGLFLFLVCRWFRFEESVDALVEKKIYHMQLGELETVISKECQIRDKKEIEAMLEFYQNLGVIVKHGNTVVLQAQWLIDLFKQLITMRPFDETVGQK